MVGDKSIIYKAYSKEKKLGENSEELWNALEGCLLNIEINDNQNKAQNIYFPKHPVFSSLSGGLRDYIMGEVSRETRREKIVSILGFVNGINVKCS